MKIQVFYKNISSDGPLEEFIKDKIGGLDHIIGNDKSSVKVEVGKPSKHHHSGPVFYAEANLSMGSNLLRAEAFGEDLRAAIVKVKEELHLQITKFKEKRTDSSRHPGG